MGITEEMTVAEIASTLPSSVRVFQRHGIDFCCGGKRPVGIACEERGVPFADVAAAIEAAAAQPAGEERDWNRAPLSALIDHIVSTYHDPLCAELPRLEALAMKVAHVHGAKAEYLTRIEAIVGELSTDLRAHMRKEELALFPAIRDVEQHRHPAGPIAAPISVMEHEHDRAGDLLTELRSITNDYVVPQWGCATFRALYQGLEELEAAMHVHVHLENNVLFPRARRLSAAV